MTITITYADMKYGHLYTNNRHPINLAIRRALGLDSVLLNCSLDLIHPDGTVVPVELDQDTIRWINRLTRDYENGRLTDEHEMELDLDECYASN